MKVAMIGTGYVGLVTGTCFAATGNNVICVDVAEQKIENLKKGIIPIYEPGLEQMVKSAQQRGNLKFTTDIKEALKESDICFIAVGTPMGEDGSADLQYVMNAAREIGQYMIHDMYIVDKSTVPVGTGDKVKAVIQEELDKRGSDLKFDVISNPEFLKEGNACQDFMHPDRVVIGSENAKSIEVMQELYEPFIRSSEFFVTMDIKSAELTKYAANAMLATKISFINEIANISERVGAPPANRIPAHPPAAAYPVRLSVPTAWRADPALSGCCYPDRPYIRKKPFYPSSIPPLCCTMSMQ